MLTVWVRRRAVDAGSCLSISIGGTIVGSSCASEADSDATSFCWAHVGAIPAVAGDTTLVITLGGQGGAIHVDSLGLFVAGEEPSVGLCG